MSISHISKIVFLIVISCAANRAGAQEEVQAKGFFSQDARKVIYIEVGKGQRLIFNSNDNPAYVLNGKKLEIRAAEVEVRGDVTVSSSPKKGDDNQDELGNGTTGPTGNQGYGDGAGGQKGLQGGQGPGGHTGGAGSPAQAVRLVIGTLAGNGTLTIDNSGAAGGRGGEGGKGGLGGHGGKGADRKNGNGPGNGGDGGPGGTGGTGGTGGAGGDGGDIYFTKSLCSLTQNKKLILLANGGGRGEGGLGGFGGPGGVHGEGGNGGNGGGGEASKFDGASLETVRGQTGEKGAEGAKGNFKVIDSSTGKCSAPTKGRTAPKIAK